MYSEKQIKCQDSDVITFDYQNWRLPTTDFNCMPIEQLRRDWTREKMKNDLTDMNCLVFMGFLPNGI